MFSNNDCISAHQGVRLLVLDLFTGACLFLPMALPKIAGKGGFLAFLIGIGLTFVYGWILSSVCSRTCLGRWMENGNSFGAKLCRVLCGFRCFASYVFLFGLFTTVLHETFLYTMHKAWIVGAMVFVLIYGSMKGVEVRARLAEIFFYIVLIPIILIGMFSLPQAEWGRLTISTGSSFIHVMQGALVTWVLMTPVEWICYLPLVSKKQKVVSIVGKAVGIGAFLVGIVYSLCVMVLDVNGMEGEAWPTVILMQIMKIPGGFVSRQDGLMLSFWIFAMYMGLSGAISHASKLLGRHGGFQKKQCVFYIISGAAISLLTGMKQSFLTLYFYVMFVTGIIWCLILVIRMWTLNSRKRYMKYMTVLLVMILGLTGCENYVALENRDFVMAIGVDLGVDSEYCFTFTFPDLAGVTGKEGKEKAEPITLEADSLEMAEYYYNQMSENLLDYGQLKILMFGREVLLKSEVVKDLSFEIKEKSEIARTVYVCKSTSKAKEVLELDKKLNTSMGLYLEKLFKNHQKEMILNDWIRQMEGEMLPEVTIYEERPGLTMR